MKDFLTLAIIICLLSSACRRNPSPGPINPSDTLGPDITWPSTLIVNSDTFRYDSSDYNVAPISSTMIFNGNPAFYIHFSKMLIPPLGNVPLNSFSTPNYCILSYVRNNTVYGIPIYGHSGYISCKTYTARKKHHLSLDSILFVNRVDTGGPLLIDGTDSLWISGDFYE